MASRQLVMLDANRRRRLAGRLGFAVSSLAYLALVLACLTSFATSGDFGLGGQPLARLAEAAWATFVIATLGSLLGAVIGLPFGMLAAHPLGAPQWLARPAKGLLDVARSIHSLVFALVLVAIIGRGPSAGILALALHSAGRYGRSFAEAVGSLDLAAVEAVRSVGASPLQVFFNAVWPTVLPQFVASHLELWEFNLRDATIVGLVGAGGLGLLIAEAAVALQWGWLASVVVVVVLLVASFDALSGRLRQVLS